jgi:hypothetical protein
LQKLILVRDPRVGEGRSVVRLDNFAVSILGVEHTFATKNVTSKRVKVLLKNEVNFLSMDDSSNGREVALYPADPGSNPHSGSV